MFGGRALATPPPQPKAALNPTLCFSSSAPLSPGRPGTRRNPDLISELRGALECDAWLESYRCRHVNQHVEREQLNPPPHQI